MKISPALVYERYGHPAEVLQLAGMPLLPLQEGEVRVQLIASPIHPSDFGMINGSYGRLVQLPAVAGREGVGEVVEVGLSVVDFQVGDKVAFLPKVPGVWQTFLTLKASELVALPANIPLLQASGALINPPTAYLLIKSIIDLQPGEWILQNGAHSAVGQLVIQLAQLLGFKTVNVVHNAQQEKALRQLGADAVVMEGSSYWKDLPSLTGGSPVRLALNSTGGNSAIALIRALSHEGTMVTFGGASSEHVKFPTKAFIFKAVRLVGFWWDHWRRQQTASTLQSLYAPLLTWMAEGKLSAPIEKVYPLKHFSAALLHAEQRGRKGKVFFAP
jgi:trans-2-enoyl-CoA reductase